jgi:hypothetical protein
VTDVEHPGITVVLDDPTIPTTIGRTGSFRRCIGAHCWYLMADPEGNEFCVVGY